MLLGLDFGTCYSSAALLVNNTAKPIKEPISRGYSFPSSIFITGKEQILIGQAAENSRQKDPQRYRREFKRDLGSPNPYTVGNLVRLPEELITEVIYKLKIEAEKVAQGLGENTLTEAVLTVPATYQPFKRQLMEKAATEAGFNRIKLLEEPVAAAVYYSRQTEIEEGENILVYDLGGGTFDATLIQKNDSSYRVLGMPRGLSHCGGTDFDRQIYQQLKNRCSVQLREQLEARDGWLARAIVTQSCRDLKHQLSEQEEATIHIPMGLTSVESYSLTRLEFNQMISPLIMETVECCDQLVRGAGIKWQQINRILLVGGSCRIPFIKEVVEQKFQRSALLVDEPELAVCLGAAINGSPKKVATTTVKPQPVSPPNSEELYKQALEKTQAKDYYSAIAILERALELKSDYGEALRLRGTIRQQIGDNQGAISDLQQAKQIFGNQQNFAQQQKALAQIQAIDDSLKPAETVTPPEKKQPDPLPTNPEPNKALSSFFAKDYPGAINYSTREIESNPDDADLYACRGLARLITKDYKGATKDFYQAVKQDANHGGAYLGRSILRALLGDHHRAIADCKKLQQIDGEFNYREHNQILAAAAQKNLDRVTDYLHQTATKFFQESEQTTSPKTKVKSPSTTNQNPSSISLQNYLSQKQQYFRSRNYTWDEQIKYRDFSWEVVAKGKQYLMGIPRNAYYVFVYFPILDMTSLRYFAQTSFDYCKEFRSRIKLMGITCYPVALVEEAKSNIISAIREEPPMVEDMVTFPSYIFPIVLSLKTQIVYSSDKKPLLNYTGWSGIRNNARQMLH